MVIIISEKENSRLLTKSIIKMVPLMVLSYCNNKYRVQCMWET